MEIIETDFHHHLIIDNIKKMIEFAAEGNFTAKQEHNGVMVLVNGDSNAELIFRDQQRAQFGYIARNIGPYPNPVLTDEERESDACVEAENKQRRQNLQAEYDAEVRAKREALKSKLVNAPQMEIADENGWQDLKYNNQRLYSTRVIAYAECWARLMQREMANGKKFEEVAQVTSHEADIDGITGFMYGCAVSILARCWKYGEQLRRWHNLDTQLGDEGEKANESGGLLNPALLSIG